MSFGLDQQAAVDIGLEPAQRADLLSTPSNSSPKTYRRRLSLKKQLESLDADNAKIILEGKPFVMHKVEGRVEFWPEAGFHAFYNATKTQPREGKQQQVSYLWMQHGDRPWKVGLTFDPSGRYSGVKYNLWTGFAVQPSLGDVGPFVEHMREVVADGDDGLADWILDWMAHAVQKPGELPGTGLILQGPQGCGKSLLVSAFASLFGDHAITLHQRDQLVGRFQDHLTGKIAIVMEECGLTPDRRDTEVEEKVKGMLTNPSLAVEAKGKPIVVVPSFLRLMLTTNREWAIMTALDDRRWTVAKVSGKRVGNVSYFTGLARLLNSKEGKAALLHFLQTRDISKFNPRKPFSNAAKQQQQILSLPSTERWWCNYLQEASPETWDTRPWSDELRMDAEEFTRLKIAQQTFGTTLQRLCPEMSKKKERDENSKGRTRYTLPSLERTRQLFATATGLPVTAFEPPETRVREQLEHDLENEHK